MRKAMFIAALCVAATGVYAQNLLQGSKLTDNWSVGLNGGAITPLTHSKFIDNMRPAIGIGLGKQLTPVFGLEVEGMGYINATPSPTAIDFSNVSLLGKFNLNNLFGSYRGTPRTFEIEAVTGAGWLHSYADGDGDQNFISTKVGLNFNFNLGSARAWTVAVKPALVYNLEGDNDHTGGYYNANLAMIELTVGVVYHFKGSNGKHHLALAKPYDQAEVNELNNKINHLRTLVSQEEHKTKEAEDMLDTAQAQIGELRKSLDACNKRSVPVQTVTKTNQTLESVITFRQGRTSVDASQLPNVERIATYMNSHPAATVVIKGYASPEGKAEVNERIARQRAEAVKSTLIHRYRIATSRITAQGQGVGDMFSEPDWNRVSICTLNDEAK